MICPKCGNPPDTMSEHQYFEYDGLSARCTPCLMYTIVGSGRWIQFPRFDGDKVLLLGFVPPMTTEAELKAVSEHETAQRVAAAELDALAKEMHEKATLKTAQRVAVAELDAWLARIVKENCEAVAAIPWTKKPESWRDRSALL